MVSNVGLNLNGLGGINTSLNSGLTTNSNLSSASIFGNGLTPVSNYEDDMLMPDFLKTTSPTYNMNIQAQAQQIAAQSQNTQTQVPTVQTSSVQTQNTPAQLPKTDMQAVRNQLQSAAQYQASKQNQLNEALLAQNSDIKVTEKGNVYQATSTGKKIGLAAGIIAPIASAIAKGAKAFSTKSFLVKLPIIGIAGYAIGALADNYINSKRAQNADKVTA